MAKHPHRLMLFNRKTWKCVECSFFVHLGLAHVLIGKEAVCWGCGDEFIIDGEALKDEQPKCEPCRTRAAGLPSAIEMSAIVERQLALAKAGVKDENELTPEKRNTMRALGLLSGPMESVSKPIRRVYETPEPPNEDEVEVDEPTSE